MKKQINLTLNERDEFFKELKKRFTCENNEFGIDVDLVTPTLPKIIPAVVAALKEIAKDQGQSTSGKVKIEFEKEEYIQYDGYELIMEYIDTALNRRIHSTTLERYADLIVDFMNEYADTQLEEKKIKVPELVDPNGELRAITNYITSTWDGFDKFDAEAFFLNVWNSCVEKTKNQFDEYAFTDLVEQWQEERQDYSKWKAAGSKIEEKEFKLSLYDDKIANIPMNILMGSMTLSRFLMDNWDYSKTANEIVANAKVEFPAASKVRPNGWLKFSKGYTDFAGISEFDDEKARKDFGGMYSGTACSPSFEIRVSLPQVMYDDKNQGRKPLETLVGTMLAHAYVMNQKNNAAKMLGEILELKKEFDKPEYFKEIVKEINIEFKEPLTKALFACFRENRKKNTFEEDLKTILGIEEQQKTKKKRI